MRFSGSGKKCQNQQHKHKIQRPSKTSQRESYESCLRATADRKEDNIRMKMEKEDGI